MARVSSIQSFRAWQEQLARSLDPTKKMVTICGGTGCTAFGASAILEAFRRELEKRGVAGDIPVKTTGCHGFCEKGPVVVLLPSKIFYPSVQVQDVPEIVERTVIGDAIIERLLYVDPITGRKIAHDHEVPFYARQQRFVFRLNGVLDPTSLEDYVAHGGYAAAVKALSDLTPQQVVEEVSGAGLRGRGGAGFPTGRKWALARAEKGEPKYLVCNADEGDPGAFMDRSLLEGTPHAILEGMIIAGYAIGASQGIIYVRAEYPLAVRNAREAVRQAQAAGLLGDNILGTGFGFDLIVREGAGAFVCGEETALLASLEGRRGMPRPRPPFPVQHGYLGKPTVINNVETLANVPLIIEKGKDWYAAIGTKTSKGTKIFALAGKVNNTGLVEVPIGATLRQIVYEIGGGIPKGRAFKAAQMGGPSGGCVPARYLDLPVDYESVKEVGAIMGSGGMIILDENTCMVDIARYFMDFCAKESCGKCPPCRIGTTRMLEILERICIGEGRPDDLGRLEELALQVKKNSLCGLGQTAPNPVLSTLRYFRDEYLEHIALKQCRASVCPGLVDAPCAHACPAGVDVPDYLTLAAEERYAEALAVVQMRNPFASVCGRVCDHPCEHRCRRTDLDEPLGIRDIKRYITDTVAAPWRPPEPWTQAEKTKHRVAVVGAGPAGLSCAYFLRFFGHQASVFEALPKPGGMLLVGIPEYRLPPERLKLDIDFILSAGVELKLNSPVANLDALFEAGYEAVFLGVGAHESTPLKNIDTATAGVLDGIQFLRDTTFGRTFGSLGRTVVVGGGNVAVDAARCARRLGAEVTIVYRRTRAEMPAYEEEIRGAEEEGVAFKFLTQPLGLVAGAGRVIALTCVRMELGTADITGRRQPAPVAGSEFQIPCDTVISAVGQRVSTQDVWGLKLTESGAYQVDPATLATTRECVFAGGDCARGPASVVQAIGDGQRAACAIDKLFGGSGRLPDNLKLSRNRYAVEGDDLVPRQRPGLAELAARTVSFNEVVATLGKAEARREARRCLRCDLEKARP